MLAFQVFRVFFVVVSTLFNAVSIAPFYEHALTRVQSAICDSTALSPHLVPFCNVLDAVLHLPPAPLVLTIDAPLHHLTIDQTLSQVNASYHPQAILPSTEEQAVGARDTMFGDLPYCTALLAHVFLSLSLVACVAYRLTMDQTLSQVNASYRPPAIIPSMEFGNLPFYAALLAHVFVWSSLVTCIAYIVAFIWRNREAVFWHCVRGLTWFFCGPVADKDANTRPSRLRKLSPPSPPPPYRAFLLGCEYCLMVASLCFVSLLLAPFLQCSPLVTEEEDRYAHSSGFIDRGLCYYPLCPCENIWDVIQVAEDPVVQEEPATARPPNTGSGDRKHVRSAARCRRIRKQKAKAREEQQQAHQSEEVEGEEGTEEQAVRRRSRGGRKVRKRQRAQERKRAARAAAKAEAGPCMTPPVFDDANFPPLAGTVAPPAQPPAGMSYALVTAATAPSTAAVIVHAGPYDVRENPAASLVCPRLEDKGRAVYQHVEEESMMNWDGWEEVARGPFARKGKRRRKGNG